MANTPNKTERERKEMLTLFANPKTAREAWRNVGAAILQNPAEPKGRVFTKQFKATAVCAAVAVLVLYPAM